MIYIIPTDTCYGLATPIDDLKNYHKIYKIKKRSMDKQLAVMVENFDYLRDHTDLTDEQVTDLENLETPFTVISDSSSLQVWLGFIDEDNNEFLNRDIYETIAFRVANTPMQKKLIKKTGPLFLTSANISNTPEKVRSKEVRAEFEYYLDKQIVEFIGENTGVLTGEYTSSDVFSYIDDSLEKEYVRKGNKA